MKSFYQLYNELNQQPMQPAPDQSQNIAKILQPVIGQLSQLHPQFAQSVYQAIAQAAQQNGLNIRLNMPTAPAQPAQQPVQQ